MGRTTTKRESLVRKHEQIIEDKYRSLEKIDLRYVLN